MEKDKRVEEYEKIVAQVDKIVIFYYYSKHRYEVELNKGEVETFKDILKRNIKPTNYPKKTKANAKIELYSNNIRIGIIAVNDDNLFASINFDKLNFDFRLTYGFGRFLDELRSKI